MSVLVLNASFEPIGVFSWQRATVLLLDGRCELLERRSDGSVIRSTGGATWPFPSVVRFQQMVSAPRRGGVPLSNQALRARDHGRCQVRGCGSKGDTIDHVIPRSKGGRHRWDNVVLMCKAHNQRKGNRLLTELGWKLESTPKAPAYEVLLNARGRTQPEWDAWLPAA